MKITEINNINDLKNESCFCFYLQRVYLESATISYLHFSSHFLGHLKHLSLGKVFKLLSLGRGSSDR